MTRKKEVKCYHFLSGVTLILFSLFLIELIVKLKPLLLSSNRCLFFFITLLISRKFCRLSLVLIKAKTDFLKLCYNYLSENILIFL
jgi:hypothetical protein